MLLDLAAPEMVKFGIESKFSSSATSTHYFKEAISTAMDEMQSMCQRAINEELTNQIPVQSHL